MPHCDNLDDLLEALGSSHPLRPLRQLGALDFERLSTRPALPLLLTPLLRDSEAEVRLETLFLLGKLQLHYKAMEPVLAALNHQDIYAQDHAEQQALQDLLQRDPRSVEFLLAALDNRVGYVRYQAFSSSDSRAGSPSRKGTSNSRLAGRETLAITTTPFSPRDIS